MSDTQSYGSLRSLIEHFIRDRFETKTEKLEPGSEAYLKLQAQFEPQAWLADAARRVSQLQVVTHSLKAIHPDAKGTNVYVTPQQLPTIPLVGSHCLPDAFEGDVVGNAAALDVYKFLKLSWGERSLLALALQRDADLLAALSPDPAEATQWVEAFAAIVEPKGAPTSHTRAKQVYWLVGDNPRHDQDYRLLAPLYSTALTHRFYEHVSPNRWFYGDDNKAARHALRDRREYEGGYIRYPDLAVQKLGGTKPQNISQLNSERGGQNYLLASLPPHWQSREIYPPRRNALGAFQRRPGVGRLVQELKAFLEADPVKNMHTRDLRDDLTAMLIDELMVFTLDMHSLAPGWSADEDCELADDEQYWLDPGRIHEDDAFAQARRQSDWSSAISDRAAHWLNRQLTYRSGLRMGDVEHRHWKQQIDETLRDFRHQLDELQTALDAEDEDTDAGDMKAGDANGGDVNSGDVNGDQAGALS
ncbi:type I-F CRISPR-associated protein Csy1 [Terasakiispira papahanaumokuakeensis]|uniref:Type I-F CRISPR-associated protein Csy1 n=1 Tax=Terasakiispira papahanaumokuakeensis TaxID=197479 RepID=A0A1E2V778_9GAMM|nr:type I-F CRISPR-associated protein Csy1 [Terasakiispira papahanaumokuakeensis]ODC02706.1 type I-F CRISPR-associated protein Csy1 [Terasakiispira papahanaumokuakeensis]